MKRVLFICLGNICRSPMAEAIFRQMVKEAGKEREYVIDSAGTSSFHKGERPHDGTLEILKRHEVSTEGLVSRPLVKADRAHFDYFICMDRENVIHATKILQDGAIDRLLQVDVPDPYYTGDFEETYRLCRDGCKNLFQKFENL